MWITQILMLINQIKLSVCVCVRERVRGGGAPFKAHLNINATDIE